MKKSIVALLLAVLMIFSLGTVALADDERAADPAQGAEFIPGSVPAEDWAAQGMVPALHGAVLAMLNHGQSSLDTSSTALSWEALYNMLSLYGQLDSRTQQEGEQLHFPAETVRDYAAALALDLDQLGQLPHDLGDRLTYDAGQDCYQAWCGTDNLAQLQILDQKNIAGGLLVDGALVYLVDGSHLARFTAVLQPRDNMFGYTITRLELTAG